MLIKNFKRIFKKPDKNAEETLREELENEGGIEKKDLPALLISAYLVIIPVAVVILLLLYFAARFLLGIW